MILAIDGDNDNIRVHYNPIMGSKSTILTDRLENFDLNPVSLGYVNHKANAHYLMRSPMRRDWRQGLRMLNLVDSQGQNPRLIGFKAIAQTIMNKFPSFKNVLAAVSSEDVNSMAFHRDFSVYHNGGLEYKGTFKVGKIDLNNGNVLIEKDWVREAFDEALEKSA